MCARFSLIVSPHQFRFLFGLDIEEAALPDEFFPTDQIPVVRQAEGSQEKECVAMRWGLIPSWSRDPKAVRHTFNARAETLREKPSFRDAYRHRRCIIPVTRFYEWPQKVKHRIERADGDLLTMAGLWEAHPTEGLTCTMVTCAPTAALAPIHDRMPLILNAEQSEEWLGPQGHLMPLCPAEVPLRIEPETTAKRS